MTHADRLQDSAEVQIEELVDIVSRNLTKGTEAGDDLTTLKITSEEKRDSVISLDNYQQRMDPNSVP